MIKDEEPNAKGKKGMGVIIRSLSAGHRQNVVDMVCNAKWQNPNVKSSPSLIANIRD